MLKDEEYGVVAGLVNPELLKDIVEIDDVLVSIGEEDHHELLTQKLGLETEDPTDLGNVIEGLYRSEAMRISVILGIEFNEAATPNMEILSDLLSSLVAMLNPENDDLFMDKLENQRDGQAFICEILEQLSNQTVLFWMGIIDDYDIGAISILKRRLEIPLDDGELIVLKEKEKLLRAYVKTFSSRDDLNYSLTFLNNREQALRFGFSFNAALVALDEELEYLVTSRQYTRLTHEVLCLALVSSLEISEALIEVREFLEDMQLPAHDLMQASNVIDKKMAVLNDQIN